MRTRIWLTASLIFCTASFGFAQQGAVAGPTAGMVFDSGAQALRPVRGIPGASTLGEPIHVSYNLTAAYVSPRQDSVFGVADGGSTHLFTLNAGAAAEVSIDGLASAPARVFFSPTGTAAALYSNGAVQIVTGLPAAPKVTGTLQLEPQSGISPRRLRTAMPSLAISDDGAYVLYASGNSIRLANPNEGSRQVITAGYGAALAFAPGGHDAAVAARGTGVVLIRDVPNVAAQQPLAADDPALDSIAGLAFSADGARLFAASASANSVIAFDTAALSRTEIACNCTPSALAAMGNLFRLNEAGAAPLWLFDPDSPGPRIVFVPALKAAQ